MSPNSKQETLRQSVSMCRGMGRLAIVLAAMMLGILAIGCEAPPPDGESAGSTTRIATMPKGPRALADVTVIMSDKSIDTILEPTPHTDDIRRSFEGDGSMRNITRYDQHRLKKLASAGQGSQLALDRHLEGPIDQEMTVKAPAPAVGLKQIAIRFTVGTEACCGLQLYGGVARVEDEHARREATFSLEWPWGEQVMVELKPTHEGGRWIWIMFSLIKDESQVPPDEQH